MPGLPPEQAGILALVIVALLLLVLLVDAGLFIAWAVRKDAVDAGMAPPLFAPRWSLVHVWVSGQVIFGLVNGLALAVIAVYALFLSLRHGPTFGTGQLQQVLVPVTLLSLFPQNVLLVAVPAWFIVRRYGMSLASIGFRLRPTRREVGLGVLYGVGMMLMAWAIMGLASVVLTALLGRARYLALEKANNLIGNEDFILSALHSPLFFVLLLLGGGVLAPIGEEFFFRGFLLNAARRRFGLWAGILLSAVCFGLVHLGPLSILGIVPIGIVLALAYVRTGSLWVPIFMHITNNSVQLVGYFALLMLRSMSRGG